MNKLIDFEFTSGIDIYFNKCVFCCLCVLGLKNYVLSYLRRVISVFVLLRWFLPVNSFNVSLVDSIINVFI